VEPEARHQAPGMNPQVNFPVGVGPDDERHQGLRAAASRKRLAAVDPPPGTGVLVDRHFLTGPNLKDQVVRTPPDWRNGLVLGPCLAPIVRIVSAEAQRGCVTSIAEHRLVSSYDAVSSHRAGKAQAVADVDNVRDGRAGESVGIRWNAEGSRQLLKAEHDEIC